MCSRSAEMYITLLNGRKRSAPKIFRECCDVLAIQKSLKTDGLRTVWHVGGLIECLFVVLPGKGDCKIIIIIFVSRRERKNG